MTAPTRQRSDYPRGSASARDGQWRGFGAPDARVIAEEARMLADPAVAIVFVRAVRGEMATGVVATLDGFVEEHGPLISDWLGDVSVPKPIAIPTELRRLMLAQRALAIPMRTPRWQAGVIALPLRSGWGPLGRELESMGAEFAERLLAADRRAQLWHVRSAAVRPRPSRRSGPTRRPSTIPWAVFPTPARRPPRVRATLFG